MLQSYKGRTLEIGQEVLVYFNLNKNKFSVKDAETGLVVSHGNGIIIESPQFIVNETGRLRVLKEKRKNVHAFVQGKFIGVTGKVSDKADRINYNPYKSGKFTLDNTATDANQKNYTKSILFNKGIFAN